MITFRSLDDNDLERYKKMILLSMDLNLDFNGTYSMYEYKGQERCLYFDDGYGVIFYLTDDGMEYRSFALDENLEIVAAQTRDYFFEYEEGYQVFTDVDTGVKSSLTFMRRPRNDVDREGYTGIVAFIQYNPNNDTRAIINYQQNKKDDGERGFIFDSTFNRNPFIISFEKNVVKKQRRNITPRQVKYLRVDASEGEPGYTYMTIHDYGLIEVLLKGSYALQKDRNINRYYRILNDEVNGYCITTYPWGIQHDPRDMSNKLANNAFFYKPPQYMIDLYNGTPTKDFEEFNEIAASLKELQKTGLLNGSYITL